MVVAAAWVLDISVATKWYLRDEELLERADVILERFGTGSLGLTAPAYFLDEGGNILRTAVRRGRISVDQARGDYASLLRLDIVIAEATSERRSAALDLGFAHDIAYYDALYLQLSDELGLPLLTADRPFFDRIIGAFPQTLYLGDV
jgi:predicted nucleic acid-binding protein